MGLQIIVFVVSALTFSFLELLCFVKSSGATGSS